MDVDTELQRLWKLAVLRELKKSIDALNPDHADLLRRANQSECAMLRLQAE